MRQHNPDTSNQQLSLYCLATGIAFLPLSGAEAAVEQIELNNPSAGYPPVALPLTLNEGEQISVFVSNVGNPGSTPSSFTLGVSNYSPSVTDAAARQDNVNYGGGVLFHTITVDSLSSDNYLGNLGCDQRIDRSLQGLGVKDDPDNSANGHFSHVGKGYEGLSGKRGFIGLEVGGTQPALPFYSRYFAYLEYELLRDDSGSEPVHTLIIHSGAVETTPDEAITAGELEGICFPIPFPWEIFMPAIIEGGS